MNCQLQFLAVIVLAAIGAEAFPKNQLATRKNTAQNGANLGVYDGKKTTISEYPYLGSLLVGGEPFCAVIIVNEHWCLTLGDCAYGQSPSDLTIVTGSNDGQSGKKYKVKSVVFHPKFGQTDLTWDACLIEIVGTIKFDKLTGPITLPEGPCNPIGPAAVAGYGDTSAEDATNNQLMCGTMNIKPLSFCKKEYDGYGLDWNKSMGCAYDEGKTTLCKGDWASGFVTKNTTENGVAFVFHGMFSAGASAGFCSSTALPVIIVNTCPMRSWIIKITSK